MLVPLGSWLVFVALIPLCVTLPQLRKLTPKTILTDFYIAGFLLCGLSNAFMFQTAQENWQVVFGGWFSVVARLLAWVLVCAFCALSYVALGYLLQRVPRASWRLVALIALFPLAELFRSYLYAIISYGPGGMLSPNFNWGSMAVPAAGTPLVYNSRIFGFVGLSALVVSVNAACYLLFFKRKYLIVVAIFGVIAGSTFVTYHLGSGSERRVLGVAAVHLNEKSDMTLLDRSEWPPRDTDILILPEYAALQKMKDYKKLLQQLSPGGIAVTTRSTGRSPGATNQIVFLDRMGKELSAQDKTLLVPTGEYLPYLLQASFKLIGKSQAVTDFTYTQQLTRGAEPERVIQSGQGVRLGALACSGVGSLTSYRQLVDQGAEVLTNSASLSFLSADSLYHVYARNMARYQAVSNNRPFVQASRSGQSFILDRQGRYIIESVGQDNQLLLATLLLQED